MIDTKELELRLASLESKLLKHASQHLIGGNDELRPSQHFRLAGTKLDLAGITYTVPSADGAVSTVLTTNGSRVLSWAAAGGLLGAGNWKSIYTNSTGVAAGVSLAAINSVLVAQGVAAAPIFSTTLSGLTLVTPAVDTINESTPAAGVTIDGVLLQDNLVGHSYLKTEQKLVAASRADYTTIASALTAAAVGWNIQANGETHNFPSSATPKSQVVLRGAGWGHTLALTGNDEMFQTAVSVTDFFVRDFYMDGNKVTYATNVETAIEMTGAANARIILENLYLKNFDYSGIELSGLDMTFMDKVLVSGMNNTGIDFTGTRSTLVNAWIDAAGMDAGADGVRVNGGSSYCSVVNTGVSNIGSVGSNRGFVFGGTVTAVSKSLFGFDTAYDWQDLGFIDDGGGGSTFNTLNRIIGCLSFDSKNPAGGGGIGGKYIKGGLYALNIAEKIIDRPGMQFGLDADDLEGMEINDLMIIANMPTGTHGGIWLDANTKNVTNATAITANVNGVLVALNRLRDGSYGATYTPQYGLRHLSTETTANPVQSPAPTFVHNYTENLWLGNLLTGQSLVGMIFQGNRGLIADNLVYGVNSGDKALTMSALSGSTFVNGNRLWNSALMDIEDLGTANLYGLNLIQKGQFTQYAGFPSSHNEVANWSFESWSAGSPIGWTATLSGAATINQESGAGNFLFGSNSARLDGSAVGASSLSFSLSNYADFKGKYVTFSCYVKTNTASIARVYVADGVTTTYSGYHSSTNQWEILTLTVRVSTSATQLIVGIHGQAGAVSVYMDGAMCTKSPFAMEASPDLRTHTHADGSEGGASLSSPTITTPTIAATGWSNANHAHAAANSGGQIAYSALSTPPTGVTGGATHGISAHDTVPSCRVRHSVGQDTTTAVTLKVAFDTEDFDTDSMHDTVTNNTRITCKTAGKYLIMGQADFAGNATGQRQMRVLLNNTTIIALQSTLTIGAGDNTRVGVQVLYDLAVNDYVELIAYQDSGSTLALSGNTYGTLFHAVRVG